MGAIAIEKISKVFTSRNQKHVIALRDVSLNVEHGEFVVLLGPSGCGKTTLLRIIGQLEKATVGMVTIDSQSGDDRPIGFVFQEATIMPWRTCLENVALPLELAGVPKKKRISKAQEMLELVELGHVGRKRPQQLSGGMRQRVSIARALVHDPEVLLMDEPFGALDAQTRDTMNLELQRIWLENRKTVVFVTHSVSEAVLLADRVVMLGTNPGHIHSITTIDLPRPRTIEMTDSEKFRQIATDLREQIGAVQRPAPGATK